MPVQLRPYRADDQEFLFKLYASTRQQEIAAFGWPEAQQQAFLRMQFTTQQRWYASAYPEAEHQIIEREGVAVGRLLVLRQAGSVLLVDIALLPDSRGLGIGTELIGQLVRECRAEKLPLRLQVLKANPAMKLYERLGFAKTGEDQVYVQMEKSPG
ncbi:MAG TPA: GNAT family N-acetyltransferase [Candidatus Angelobacter sp.]|nr:GNAT family N-acetyltransferase [Candidatus Angelobacter sp.]